MEHEELFPLLCKVAEGNQKAFETLYEKTSGQLYAIALKMLNNQALAEEATQDAFIKIWHNAGSYQSGRGTVLTWMVSIVRYRALDSIRYHNVRKEVTLPEDIESDKQNNSKSTSELKKLESCMSELDDSHRHAIHLAYFGGLSHHEVTQHMASPLGTVKSWIRRGLQSLQRCLSL
ncbi:MAG: sigma-70 family RNA polymerase sigma factor [Glaciecola sp.]